MSVLLLPPVDEGYKSAFLRRLLSPDKNLLSNPGFETAGTGGADIWANWSETVSDGALANETVGPHEGDDAAKVTAGTSLNTNVAQSFVTIAEKKYLFRFHTKGDGTYSGLYRIYDNSNSGDILAAVTTGIAVAIYGLVMKEFTAPVGCVSVGILFICPSTNGGVAYFDTAKVHLLN